MGLWDFVAMAVVAGCLLEAYKVYARSHRGHADNGEVRSRIEALEAQAAANAKLEERVRTLEAIVTDSRYELEREMNKLDAG